MKNNLILALVILSLLSITQVMAFDFDNRGTYDQLTKTATINNAFGFGHQIASATLETPQEVLLMPGPNQKVGTIHITLNDDNYADALQKIDSYNLNNDNLSLGRVFVYKVYQKVSDKEVPITHEVCKDVYVDYLKTTENHCDQVPTGNNRIDDVYDWVIINSTSLSKGEYDIGVFTDVKPGDHVDWIPQLFGVRVSQWAVFTDAMKVGLKVWNQFDGGDTSTIAYNIRNATINGTKSNGVGNVSGIILRGSAYASGSNQFVTENFTCPSGGNQISISLWFNYTSENNQWIVGCGLDNTGQAFGAYVNQAGSDHKVYLWRQGTDLASPGTVTQGVYHHLVIVQSNSTNRTMYLDGQNVANQSTVAYNVDGTTNLLLGAYKASSGGPFDGTIDEVGVWNRSLSPDEVTSLYNGGAGLTYTASATFSNFNSTIANNSQYVANTQYNFTAQIVGSNGTAWMQFVNTNYSSTNVSNNFSANFTGLNPGTYSYFWGAWNTDGTVATSTTQYYTVSTPTTSINFTNPTPITGTRQSSNSFIINLSTNSSNFANLTINLYNSTALFNSTNSLSTPFLINYTSLPDSVYFYNATIYDNINDTNITEKRNITIDSTPPIVNIVYPLNGTQIITTNNQINITFNASISDNVGLTNCFYNNETANVTLANCGTNATISFLGGTHTLIRYANNSVGNIAQNITTFFINTVNITAGYIDPAIEGEIYNFNLTINASNISTINGSFTYNNTQYNSTITINGNTAIFSNQITTPLITPAAINMTFFWNYTINGFNATSGFYNHTLYNFGLDNCTSNTIKIMNITNYDEELLTQIPNSTIEIGLILYNSDRSQQISNYSSSSIRNTPLDICVARPLTNSSNYSLDAIIRYTANNYANEYYNIMSLNLLASTPFQETSLYDLNSTASTDFRLTFTGSDFLPSANTLVYLNRRYISSGYNFSRTVEVPKTDSNGQAILHMVRNNVVYDISMVKDGVLLASFQNQIAFCDDFSIGQCEIILNGFTEVQKSYNYNNEIGISYSPPSYDNNTNTISFTYTTLDGSIKNLVMNVSRNDIFGNRSICSNTISSASGTVTCSTPANLQDSVLIVTIYDANGKLLASNDVQLAPTGYGPGGLIIYFIMALSLLLMFSESKEGIIFSMILSIISGVGLGIIQGGILAISSGSMWFIIVCLIGLWRLNKDRPQ